MVNRPKQIGTAAETAVVRFLRDHGFRQAERRALTGALDKGDITGTPGIVWEVKGGQAAKNASDGQITKWLEETHAERRNAGGIVGILVLQRPGIGLTNAGRWWAIGRIDDFANHCDANFGLHWPAPVRVHLDTYVELLRRGGFGDPL